MAILAAWVGFCFLIKGFTNRHPWNAWEVFSIPPYTGRQATYDLRRLKRKGLIAKVPRSRRYQLTCLGRRVAVLFTKTYGRVLAPGLSALDPTLPEDVAARSRVGTAWRCFDRALDEFIHVTVGCSVKLDRFVNLLGPTFGPPSGSNEQSPVETSV